MASFLHTDYQDGGPDMLRTRAATANRIRLRALGSYTAGASFAAVQSATIGVASLTPADITTAGALGATRQNTIAAKTITLTGGGLSANLHWAITDDTGSKVLLVEKATASAGTLVAEGQLISSASVFSRHPQPSSP